MTTFDWIIKLGSEYGVQFLKGAGSTLIMALTGTVIGFIIGLLIAMVRTIPVYSTDNIVKRVAMRIVNLLLSVYVEVIRGTPMLVQALIIHYSIFVSLKVPVLVSAIIIISFNTGAYMAEIVRGGIISIDKGQFEGAHAIGMTHWQTMTNVVLPQAIRNIMPSIGNEFVVNIKDSSVLSVISITELMFMAKMAGGAYAKFVPAYLICAIIYFVLTFTVTRILRLLEKKMDGSDSYTIFGSQSSSTAEIKTGGN
ncbi:MAG: amino acid ABC transporter permease [Clostridia bacterium]|nr:amino acid ABC transporter permease [Clostridia bacterium]MBQ1258896.1 amino acid ABC transporter permease [Clostridia bacterium]